MGYAINGTTTAGSPQGPGQKRRKKPRRVGDAYITTQELKEKVQRDQERISAKRESLRQTSAKPHAQSSLATFQNDHLGSSVRSAGTAKTRKRQHSRQEMFLDEPETLGKDLSCQEQDYLLYPHGDGSNFEVVIDSFQELTQEFCSPNLRLPPKTTRTTYSDDSTTSLSSYQSNAHSDTDYSDVWTQDGEEYQHNHPVESKMIQKKEYGPSSWSKIFPLPGVPSPKRSLHYNRNPRSNHNKRGNNYGTEKYSTAQVGDIDCESIESSASYLGTHDAEERSGFSKLMERIVEKQELEQEQPYPEVKESWAKDDDIEISLEKKSCMAWSPKRNKDDDDENKKHSQKEKEQSKTNAMKRIRSLCDPEQRERERQEKLQAQKQRTKLKASPWSQLFSSPRLFISGAIVFSIVFAVVMVLVFVLPQSNNHSSRDNHLTDKVIDDMVVGCQRETNILPECRCRSSMEKPLENEVSFARKLLLDFLANSELIQEESYYMSSMSGLSDEDREIAKLFVEAETSCSVFNQAVLFTSNFSNHVERPPSKTALSQRFMLALLYQTLGGESWNQNKWLQPKLGECDWYGITCSSGTNKILKIDLSNNGLWGPITAISNIIGRGLPTLRQLDLSYNPQIFGKLAIDGFTKNLPTLQSLDLSYTSMENGQIPSELGRFSRLTELNLANSNHNGTLPSELGRLTELRILDVSANVFTGTIPDISWSSLQRLEYLNISYNQFQGDMPLSWKSWDQLETLAMNGNSGLNNRWLPEEPYGPNMAFVYLFKTNSIPMSYCTTLPYLDTLQVDCDISALTKQKNQALPCDCCTCNYVI